jgi:hypothetical protein
MSRTRLAAATLAASAVMLAAGAGPALASHGGGGTGGGTGGGGAPPAPAPPAAAPTLTISPASVTFGPQAVSTTSPAQTVTVTNTGTASVFFNAESPGGTNVLDFLDLNSQCVGSAIAPGASCALTISFRPTATGTRTADIQLVDNAANSPQTINLTGTGTSTAGPTPLTVDTTGLTCTGGVCAIGGDSIVKNFFFFTFGAVGDTAPPFAWSVVGGALPAGLSLAANGQLSGTPTAVGTSTFTLKVVDPAGKTATQAFSLTIIPAPVSPAGCPRITGSPGSVSAKLSGPAIAGKAPSGQAVLDESRVTSCGGSAILNASLSGVNLPNGTVLWMAFDSELVGRVVIQNGGAQMAPFNLGDFLSRKDSMAVYSSPPPETLLAQTVLSSGFFQ